MGRLRAAGGQRDRDPAAAPAGIARAAGRLGGAVDYLAGSRRSRVVGNVPLLFPRDVGRWVDLGIATDHHPGHGDAAACDRTC